MATVKPAEQAPLNTEKNKEERDVEKLEVGSSESQPKGTRESIAEMTEKLKKPTIGIGLVIFLVLNTIMFFVGITTTKDCTIQPLIPIYLAVAGALGVVTKIIPIVNRNRRTVILDRIVAVLGIAELIWMIVGSYWIYSIYKPNYDSEHGAYCNKTAYLLAFWLLTLNYIFLILIITVPCCIICGFCCLAAVCIAQN